jgi:tetratricopeptide (TPR) repeat protein
VDIRLGLDDPANLAHFHAMADKLKRLYRGWAETLQTVAWDERKKGHYMESLELAKKATLSRAACPQGRAYSFFEYAYFLQCAGSAEAARDQYTVAVDKYAQDPVIEDHLAQTYLMQTNFVQGLEHLQKSIEQLPTHQNGHLYLGRAYEAMNNFDKAIAEFKEAERLRGNDAKSQAFYDELRRAAQQGGADGYWRRQLLEALTDPHEPYRIAKCYAHLGPAEKENAYKFLELACEQHDSSIEAMLCDLAWDRNDERVKSVARKVGLIR